LYYSSLKKIKNYKPYSILLFIGAFIAFKSYINYHLENKQGFVNINGQIDICELTEEIKYKYLTFKFKGQENIIYKIYGPNLNDIDEYTSLCEKIKYDKLISIITKKSDIKGDIQVYSISSDDQIYLDKKDSIEYEKNSQAVTLILGVISLLSGLFLLSGYDIIYRNGKFNIS